QGIEWHFSAEESRLFPSFEAATGTTAGPTSVMREEHAQLRELMEGCGEALASHDANGFAGQAETLLILLQQHNAKEENILYPMCERMLGSGGEDFAADFAAEIAALCPS
ncbi:MAG: hemerythrin domain-containing protein, partial [Proteobacteria bacterium]|nr:hemerythrin domain-containing protein [Pseudomonadota bacterium]